jgi:antitoxin ParD1/3/4
LSFFFFRHPERLRIYRGRFEELKREVMIGVEELRRQEGINAEEVFSELEEDLQQIEAKGFPMSQK